METRGYVIAGGRSSRMGVDKGEVRLGGRTLLEIAVGKLRQVCESVVVVGERAHVPAGVRVVRDLRRDCGPLGGIEAALLDADGRAAMFLPVDMPFVPEGLLTRLVAEWDRREAWTGFAVVDGRVQPLVCRMRPEMLGAVQGALGRGEYKVRPVLEGGGRDGVARQAPGAIVGSEISTGRRESVWPGWMPSDAEWELREFWFANLNTPDEWRAAEAALAGRGLPAGVMDGVETSS